VTPAPSPPSCDLPDQLPKPPTPVAAPAVSNSGATMVFSSYLYERDDTGGLVARDRPGDDWAMGVWFATPGLSAPRLLAADEDGMVLPLGLSPKGDIAAVWVLPRRHIQDELDCPSGIYLVETSGAGSRGLLLTGEFPLNPDRGQGWDFIDLFDEGRPQFYGLPTASFSDDGQLVALVRGDDIQIWLPEVGEPIREHLGECRSWDWAPGDQNFVAGCERLTTAWAARLGDGYLPDHLALPVPAIPRNFGPESEGALAFGPNGDLLVVRFFGLAIDCSPSGCPINGWSRTRIDPVTLHATTTTGEVDFLAGDATTQNVRISGDGTWAWVERLDGRISIVSFDTGNVATIRRPGTIVGARMDRTRLFGYRVDGGPELLVVWSIGPGGHVQDAASIRWPEDVQTVGIGPAAPGLFVTR